MNGLAFGAFGTTISLIFGKMYGFLFHFELGMVQKSKA